MGGLAGYLEKEGLATTQISLIREHTERIKPPRALWVPFDLGRPLGAPNDPGFQKRVLRAALSLLIKKSGPVIEDFPEDAPRTKDAGGPLACPVNFAGPDEAAEPSLYQAFAQEAAALDTWHQAARSSSGRSTFGMSGLKVDEIVALLSALAKGDEPAWPQGMDKGEALRFAAQDIKAFYLEAMAAQPGCDKSVDSLNRWFWTETRAGRVLKKVRRTHSDSPDKPLGVTALHLIVPRQYL